MDYSWQGSDNRKLSMLKDLYRKELDNNQELTSMSFEDKPTIHICNSAPPQDTIFWYVQNTSSSNIDELVKHYFKYKENYYIIEPGYYYNIIPEMEFYINSINVVFIE